MDDSTGERTRYWLIYNYGSSYWDCIMWSNNFQKIFHNWFIRVSETEQYAIACNISAF